MVHAGEGKAHVPWSMAAGKVSADAVTKSQERIYSAQQLVQALKSGAAAIKEQLQVLCILDGTASSWPGVNQGECRPHQHV